MSIKYLDSQELCNLFSMIKRHGPVRDQCLFKIIFHYGLRVSEVAQIQLNDIKPVISQPSEIFIRRSKSGISRHYPLTLVDSKLIKRWEKERRKIDNADYNEFLFITNRSLSSPISIDTLKWLFTKYATLAGVERSKRHIHCLRHSAAVHLLSAGQDVYFVKEFLGHKSLASTLRYSDLMPSGWSNRSSIAVEQLATI